MDGLDGARLQLEVGERVILIGAIIDAGLPGLVRKGGMGQRTQAEQGAHEKVCQPEAKAHLEAFLTRLLQRSQLISPEVQWPLSPLITERECWPPSSACAPSSPPLPPGPRQALPTDPKLEQAREHLTTATTMYGEMDMRFWLEQTEVELRGLA